MLRRSRLGGEVRAFYRKTLRVVFQLEERHQRIWYDYLRLKFGESADVRDDRKVKRLLAAGHEEVDWVVSVLERKNKPRVQESLYNGTFARALHDESHSPLAKLQKPAGSRARDDIDDDDEEERTMTAAEFTSTFGQLLRRPQVDKTTLKNRAYQANKAAAAAAAAAAAEQAAASTVPPVGGGIDSLKAEDLAALELKMQQLVADRKREEQEEAELQLQILQRTQLLRRDLIRQGLDGTAESVEGGANSDGEEGGEEEVKRITYADAFGNAVDLAELLHEPPNEPRPSFHLSRPHNQQQQQQQQQVSTLVTGSSPNEPFVAHFTAASASPQFPYGAPVQVRVSANAFQRRLKPSSSAGVKKIKSLQARGMAAAAAAAAAAATAEGFDCQQASSPPTTESHMRRVAYEFSHEFPAPPISRRAAAAAAPAPAPATAPATATATAPTSRPEAFIPASARIHTLSLDGSAGPASEAAPGRWGYDTTVETTSPTSPRGPAQRASPRRHQLQQQQQLQQQSALVRYPVATRGGVFTEIVFDPRGFSLMVLAIKDGAVASLVDVELSSVVATTSKAAPDMVSLRSPQCPQAGGYMGCISALAWAELGDKARKARLYQEHFDGGGRAGGKGATAAAASSAASAAATTAAAAAAAAAAGGDEGLVRRRQILLDSTFGAAARGGGAAVDLSGAMTIFNMTSLPTAADDHGGGPGRRGGGRGGGREEDDGAGSDGEEYDEQPLPQIRRAQPPATPRLQAPSPAGPKPPTAAASVFVPAYSSSRAVRLLLVESREAMQIYFRVKLQPFFRSVDCVATLAEALSAPVQKGQHGVIFLHCIDILRDDTPYDSMKRLGGVGGGGGGVGGGGGGGAAATAGRGVIAVNKAPEKLICVYGVPNYAETGEEMLAFVETLCSCGVTDILDDPFTYEQVTQVIAKICP